MTDLRAEALSLAHDDREVVRGLDLELPDGAITAIVGANACDKSTLLRGLARLLKPRARRLHAAASAASSSPVGGVGSTIA